ncbi:hypothetical protein GVAV_003329 [Gurleya vavrai]
MEKDDSQIILKNISRLYKIIGVLHEKLYRKSKINNKTENLIKGLYTLTVKENKKYKATTNAYTVFRVQLYPMLKKLHPNKTRSQILPEAAELYKGLDSDIKDFFENLAKEDRKALRKQRFVNDTKNLE